MLTDDERTRLSTAVYEGLRRLLANNEELNHEAYRLTQCFEDCLEECMKRAVKADRAGRGPGETLGLLLGLSGEPVFDGDGEEFVATTPDETGVALVAMPLEALRKLGPALFNEVSVMPTGRRKGADSVARDTVEPST